FRLFLGVDLDGGRDLQVLANHIDAHVWIPVSRVSRNRPTSRGRSRPITTPPARHGSEDPFPDPPSAGAFETGPSRPHSGHFSPSTMGYPQYTHSPASCRC